MRTNKEQNASIVNLDYLFNVCLDMAYTSKKAHKTFNKNEIKGKYVDNLKQAIDKLKEILETRDYSKIEKAFRDTEKLLDRYVSLDSKMTIKPTYNQTNEKIFKVEEADYKDVSAIREIFSVAKQNALEKIERKIAQEKEQEHIQESRAEDLAKIQEKNKKEAADMFYEGVKCEKESAEYYSKLAAAAREEPQKRRDQGYVGEEIWNGPISEELKELEKARGNTDSDKSR